jgi:hypothetical protein
MNTKFKSFMIALFLLVAIISALRPGSAITWSSDIRLTTDPADDWDPAIAQTTDGRIWVTWHSDRTGNNEIFYKIRTGSSWSSDIQLTSNPSADEHSAILQTAGGTVWVFWDSDRTGDLEIYYKTTVDGGASWSADTRLTMDLARDSFPSIMEASDGKIWVFWTSGRNVTVVPPDPTYLQTANIFYKISSDSGQTWSADTLLVTDFKNNYWDDLYPSAMQAANSSIWVVWSRDAKDLFYTIYNGTGWCSGVRLTLPGTGQNTHPFIVQTVNDRIWVFWDTDRNAHDSNVYYKIFDDSWTSDIPLTTALEDDEWPSMLQADDSSIWVVWTSPRYPQLYYDIFWRTGMELHDIAVRGVTPYTNHQDNTLAYRGEVVHLEVEVENQGEGRETFEVRGYANSTWVDSETVTLDPAQSFVMVFEWNTSRVRPGMYVPNAVAVAVQGETDTGDNYMTGNPFEVRIMGDICGFYGGILKPIPDRRVNLDDFMVVVANWGTTSSNWNPVWGPASDVTGDGMVDIDDVMTVGLHFGEA